MGRPRVPLVERNAVIAMALDIIDRDGLSAFAVGRVAEALGVSGPALYHHFNDRDDILAHVGRFVVEQAQIIPRREPERWQDLVQISISRYREALVAHPNALPLLVPGGAAVLGNAPRERIVAKMMDQGVPAKHCYAIIDSAALLAVGSALTNPEQRTVRDRVNLDDQGVTSPRLAEAVRQAPRSADALFRSQLTALLGGWEGVIAAA